MIAGVGICKLQTVTHKFFELLTCQKVRRDFEVKKRRLRRNSPTHYKAHLKELVKEPQIRQKKERIIYFFPALIFHLNHFLYKILVFSTVFENLISNPSQVLHGLTSWGFGCAEAAHPGVYTEVRNYIGWMKGHVTGTATTEEPGTTEPWTTGRWNTEDRGRH